MDITVSKFRCKGSIFNPLISANSRRQESYRWHHNPSPINYSPVFRVYITLFNQSSTNINKIIHHHRKSNNNQPEELQKRRRRWMPDLKNLMGSLSFDKRWTRVKMRELLPEAVAARSRRRSSPEDSWKQIPQRKSTPYGEQMMNESMVFAGRFGP